MSPENMPTDTADQLNQLRADMELLNSDDVSDVKVGDKVKGNKEDEDEELPEDAESEDEPDEEGERGEDKEGKEDKEGEGKEEGGDKTPIHSRPTLTEIKSAYPDFFKKFPEMRHMLFREQEYTNLFPTMDDAREAQENAQDFQHFSTLVNSGKQEDFVEFLNGVKQNDSLESFATNFLPSLYKSDKDTYFAVTTPIAESLLRNAYKAAERSGDENLLNAALHVARWALGDVGFATGEKTSVVPKVEPTEGKKDDKYEKEKNEFYTARYNDSKSYVATTAYTRLSSEIKKGLDPNGVLNDFTTQLLVKEILNEVGSTLEADKSHMDTINSMWRHAHKAGFAGNWKDRILTTYMSRARAIMPAIRARIRSQAIADQKERAVNKGERASKSLDRKEIQGSQNLGQMGKAGGRAPSANEVDWRKTSDMDILNDRVTLKSRK